MDQGSIQRSCALVSSHKKVKYFPFKMRGYGPLKALVNRVTREITHKIYG